MEQLVYKILKKENISYKYVTKAASGFTNVVYFIDDKYVIKISKDEKTKHKLDKETLIYKHFKLSYIPQYITSGNLDEYRYLIISKLKGHSLYSIWHTLTSNERQSCVKQIAHILKDFNHQNYDFLTDEYKEFNWTQYLSNQLNDRSQSLKQMGFNTDNIDNFVIHELPVLFSNNKFGLVYNDAHFDNFIYNDGKLSLIDFDRVRVCPIDYEMLIFKTMCDNPSKFASEEDEDNIKDEHYSNIYNLFRLEYPEMFEINNIEKRISVYQFNYLIEQAIKCNNKAWATELLNNFNK